MVKGITKITFAVLFGLMFCASVFAQPVGDVTDKYHQEEISRQDNSPEAKELRQKRDLEERRKAEQAEKAEAVDADDAGKLQLPEDATPLLAVKQLRISGNTLITTQKLLAKVPAIFSSSGKPVEKAEINSLYDFRGIQDVIADPGVSRQISTRTIQGFTQYILSVYQKQNYAGIHVSVPQGTISDGKLRDDQLLIAVTEILVTEVRTVLFDVERNVKLEGYLLEGILEEWSPIKSGQVANEKELDDFVNLLNLNPDRYVSATISEGNVPGSLAIGYDVYEVDPWHYFIQIDNSGTKDRQWSPMLGLINTNLTGRDDKLTTYVQIAGERTVEGEDITNNYSVYGSYDFPLWTQRLRLKIFAGRSEYETDAGAGIDFLGHGSFYGGELRFNALQHEGWFFDITSSLSQEKTKVTRLLGPFNTGSEVTMNLWGLGVEAYRRNDLSNTLFKINRVQSITGASGQSHYTDIGRQNADQDFEILTFSANHSQFLNPDKVHRFVGSFKYIRPNARLIPAKMTTFGGMYSVRGYRESRIVADGGLLASLQ